MYVCLHACEYMCACARARMRLCACVCMHARICTCAYVCELMSMYVFLSTLVDVETNQV